MRVHGRALSRSAQRDAVPAATQQNQPVGERALVAGKAGSAGGGNDGSDGGQAQPSGEAAGVKRRKIDACRWRRVRGRETRHGTRADETDGQTH